MKNKIILIILILVISVSVGTLVYASVSLTKEEKEENSHLVGITFSELEEKVNKQESFILLLSQTTCSHCAEYRPVFKKVLKANDLIAYEIATDLLTTEENAKLKDIANVSGTPTTVFIVNGEEVNTANRLVGSASESKITSRLKALGYIS